MSPDGIRYTHPTPSADRQALRRHLPARRRRATRSPRPTRARSGARCAPSCRSTTSAATSIALVGVGVLTDAIGDEVAALLPGLLGLALAVLAVGGGLSLLLARRAQAPDARPRAAGDRDAVRPPRRDAALACAKAWSCSTSTAGPRSINDEAQTLLGDDAARSGRARRRHAADRRRPRPARVRAAPSSATAAASAPSSPCATGPRSRRWRASSARRRRSPTRCAPRRTRPPTACT